MTAKDIHKGSYWWQIIDWFLFTSFFAACCAGSLCIATEKLLLGQLPPFFTPLHAFVLGSTLLVYNVHYVVKRSSPQVSDRFSWSQHYKPWHYALCVVGFLMCTSSLFFLSWKILLSCVVLGLLSFAYSLPLLPFKNKKRIRDFGWIKILVLTAVWTIVTAILPILFWDKQIMAYPFEILMRFVFMFVLCVAFDIRDMQTDLEAHIYTLPNLIGVSNSYRLMYGALILFVFLCLMQYTHYPSVSRLIANMISTLATWYVIIYTKKHPSDRAYLGLVDGMMLLYAFLIAL